VARDGSDILSDPPTAARDAPGSAQVTQQVRLGHATLGRNPDITEMTGSDTSERERFELLYRTHLSAVLAYAARRAAPGTSPDIAAEVFLIAWRRLPDIPSDPLPWLLVVARNLLLNQRRGLGRKDALTERLIDEQRRHALAAEPADSDPDLIAALNRLPADDRELLCLEAWDGLSREQLAAVVGCSVATLRVRLHRARARLAHELAAVRVQEHQSTLEEGVQ
jgi:RNA polymerase sigma factor (sigma-70 family)